MHVLCEETREPFLVKNKRNEIIKKKGFANDNDFNNSILKESKNDAYSDIWSYYDVLV